MNYEGIGKTIYKKNQIRIIEKNTDKINVKLPHVNKNH